MLETKDGRFIAVDELKWDDLVNEVFLINPNLANLIEQLVEKDFDCTFYKASYQFGNRIIGEGKCYLPLANGDSIAFDDPQLPEFLIDDLNYNPDTEDPLGMVLTKSSEFHLPSQNRVRPHAIIHKGQMFGIPRAIDANTGRLPSSALEFSLNAGARSLFMLSKISDRLHHAKLQEAYKTRLPAPVSLQEHWAVFTEIAKGVECSWRSEIIYFPRKWINKLKTPAWSNLANYLMQMHRGSYNIWHNISVIWINVFHDIEQEKRLTNYPLPSLETAKHMFLLAANSSPGFKPATNDEMAPISLLQDAYRNIYNKKAQPKYSTVIMEPVTFNSQNNDPIYYSLNHPTFISNNLEASKKKSQISLLDEIRWLIDIYSNAILTSKRNIKSLYDVVNTTTFSYYHTNPEGYKDILNAATLEKDDPRFAHGQVDVFPTNSPFFKGCIKISRKALK